MGLFGRARSSVKTQPAPDEKIYVFMRAPGISSTANLKWSLAVLQAEPPKTPTGPTNGTSQLPKQKKPFFSFATRTDSPPTRPSSRAQTPTLRTGSPPVLILHEFSLSNGALNVKRHKTSTSVRHTTVANSRLEPVLLQILLPSPSPSPHPQSLIHRIEATLQQVTASNSNLSIPSSTWLKLSLIALQTAAILPDPSSGLDVEKFTAFARNAFTGFEGECLALPPTPTPTRHASTPGDRRGGIDSGSTSAGVDTAFGSIELGASHVKVVDYAGHVRENERLRAMFGHEGGEARGAAGRNVGAGGLGHGGWWIGQSHHGLRREASPGYGDRDPYGGLM